jgi:Cu-Zn family superoxide dismutase
MELIYKNKYIKYKQKYLNCKDQSNTIKAIAVFINSDIKGNVKFEEINNNLVMIDINLEGFIPNSIHGFHVHESGDLTENCDSLCSHFNPYNKNHGGKDDIERHVGDLGNIQADNNGKVQIKLTDHLIKLRGNEANIIGRSLIVHADQDDCGKGNHHDSKTTGHSGKRLGCAIIGYSKVC